MDWCLSKTIKFTKKELLFQTFSSTRNLQIIQIICNMLPRDSLFAAASNVSFNQLL